VSAQLKQAENIEKAVNQELTLRLNLLSQGRRNNLLGARAAPLH
jgi:hypothetical protein